MRTFRWSLVLITLVLALAPAALADEHTPLGAEPLQGSLPGNPWAGSSHLYQLAYPGNGLAVTVRLRSLLPDAVINSAFGFNLYGPYGYDEQAPWDSAGRYRQQTYSAAAPATLTVQVYNYSRSTIPYELAVLGLSEAPSAEPLSAVAPLPPVPTPVAVSALDPAQAQFSGALLGDSAGRFAEYRVATLAGEQVTVTLVHQPIDPSFGRAVGLNVYGTDGELTARAIEREPHRWACSFRAAYTGEYVLLVHNYAPGMTVIYTLTIVR